jgi:flagellar assembly factor FliW
MTALLTPPPPDALPADAAVSVASDLLGAVEVPAAACFDFPDGLPGFDGARRFALVPAGRAGLFWLQSRDASGLVFLLADPFHWLGAYDVDVAPADVQALGASSADDLAVLAIVTLPQAPGESASVNLRAPVLLGHSARRGRQLVRADERYDVRAPLALG